MKKYMKIASAVLAVVVLVFCMAGCGAEKANETPQPAETAAAEPGTPAEEEITITFWHTYGDAEEEQFLNAVLPLWEELHPNIKVEAVRQDSSQYHEMIVTSFGTGMSPDVAHHQCGLLREPGRSCGIE